VVKSCCSKLERILVLEGGRRVSVNHVLEAIWKSPAPLKVVVSSWRVFLDRIPTRNNFRGGNIIFPEGSLTCVYCEAVEESVNHLFLHCRVGIGFWLIWHATIWVI